ncbi:MAG: superoxide dismutase family protein, partial [Proteobacteria bacterium]|nr:superoxide dismutase family protein [Pseudomonadota bacterium]
MPHDRKYDQQGASDMKYATLLTLGTVALGLSACDQTKMETGAPLPGAPSATATLRTGTGADAGRA